MKKLFQLIGFHLPAIVFTIWVESLCWLLFGERFHAYLQPRLWPFLLAATVILAVFIAVLIFGRASAEEVKPPKGNLLKLLVLVVPIVFLYASQGQSLSSHAFSKKTVETGAGTLSPIVESRPERTGPSEAARISLLEIVQSTAQWTGKRVITQGEVYKDEKVPPKSLLLFQFGIVCCAADAVPLWVLVQGEHPELESLNNQEWIEVEGELTFMELNDKQVRVIIPHGITRITPPPPESRYLYF